ncbi:MAG: hypothetical protein IPM63_11555 [Acidobacteriota bacterium]|nr:MAG: hypothetical protein IPM63_11555 [Acidobacteriota bacterium]
MLRITETARTDNSVTYLVEGRVGPSGLKEIDRICSLEIESAVTPVLDLSRLSFVDRAAVEGFRSLKRRPVRMINCSPFLAEQLKLGECNAK